MWNPNIRVNNINKLHKWAVQMIFNVWFGYFEYVGYLLHGITLIALSECLDLITINFNCFTWPWNTVQQEIPNMKLLKPLLTHSISHSSLSIDCTKLILSFSCDFTFLEIIKHNVLKCCFLLPSSVLKWIYKYSPILVF